MTLQVILVTILEQVDVFVRVIAEQSLQDCILSPILSVIRIFLFFSEAQSFVH